MTTTSGTTAPRLERPRDGRMIAGVCAAIARRFDVSPTLVRVLALLSILLPGPQVVIYVICWIAIPSAPRVPVVTTVT